MEVENKVKEFEFVAEIKQLLDLIINSLYVHPEIFVRELISNSSDALHKIRFIKLTNPDVLDPEQELRIDIFVDPSSNTFIIEDTGIGMTEEEVIEQIGTIAKSGTFNFLNQIKDDNKLDLNLIGKFGVGFYSVFMVTDEVTLQTRSYKPDSTAVQWKSDGKGKYTIKPIERQRRGTKIYFKLKEDYKEFSQPERVKEIIRKYSNFVDFPVYVNNEKVNTVQAIWHKSKDELTEQEAKEFYKFLTNDENEPLSYFQLSVEGSVSFKALLFIPKKLPALYFQDFIDKSIALYSHKVFIQDDNPEILPVYLRFVRGVVDTEDLPLNVSRETVQNSIVIRKIRQILTNKILAHLEDLSNERADDYSLFIDQFGQILKGGIPVDEENRKKIIELLRFHSSSQPDFAFTSLKDYVSRMKPEQTEIYYTLVDSLENAFRNPNMEYFKENNIEVLLLDEPVDALILPYIIDYQGKPLKSIDKANIRIEEKGGNGDGYPSIELLNKFIDKVKTILGDKVLNVQISNRLVESPATLVASEYAFDQKAEKIFKILDKNFQKSPKIFEINPKHKIIKSLIKKFENEPEDELIDKVIIQLYEQTLLLEGELESPHNFVNRMNEILEQILKD